MRYFEPREEYSYEKRGNNYYGFCDQGCKVEVRPRLASLRDVMQKHWAKHHGQMTMQLGVVDRQDIGDVPPF